MGQPQRVTVQRMLEAGDVAGCLAFFAALPPAERRSHFETARRLSVDLWGRTGKGIPWSHDVHDAVGVALMASATLSELGKLNLWVPRIEVAMEAARTLRPSWLSGWAEALVEESPRRWLLARCLVREGLSRKPSSDGYILGMLLSWPLHDQAQHSPRRTPWERLENDPALLEDEVWRIFEVEGGGEFSLAAVDKYEQHTWQASLVELAARGRLDRDRLLDCSLQALQRDFAQFRASWYSRFHEALRPTPDERAARVQTYLQLLHSRIPPTVAFALDAVARLDKAGRLPLDGLPAALAPVMDAPQKTVVLRGLELLGRAARRRPDLAGDVARRAAEALANPTADVQAAALTLVEKLGSREDPALRDAVRQLADGVAPSVQGRVRGWLDEAAPPAAEAPARHAAAPLDLAPPPLAPIAEVSELLDVFARVVEDAAAPDDVERVLDGVSRLCDQRVDPRLLAPLVKRARTLGASPRPMQRELARLALAWGSGEVVAAAPYETLTDLLSRRITRIAERAVRREAKPLRALPTHRGGRIASDCATHPADEDDRLAADLRTLSAGPCTPALRFERHDYGSSQHVSLRVDPPTDPAAPLLWTLPVGDTEAEIRHAATLCPNDPRPFFAQGITAIGNNLDWWEARWGDCAWLEPLLDPSTPLPRFGQAGRADADPDRVETQGLGVLLLVLGLASKAPAQQRLAVDALAATLDDGRLDAADAAGAMAMLLAHDYVKPARWARTLGDAARISPAHARAVATMIERAIRQAVTRMQAPLLELLHELLVDQGAALSDAETRLHLERCPVGGRTGRLCQSLLALRVTQPGAQGGLDVPQAMARLREDG